jgi:hypothetical protein
MPVIDHRKGGSLLNTSFVAYHTTSVSSASLALRTAYLYDTGQKGTHMI